MKALIINYAYISHHTKAGIAEIEQKIKCNKCESPNKLINAQLHKTEQPTFKKKCKPCTY